MYANRDEILLNKNNIPINQAFGGRKQTGERMFGIRHREKWNPPNPVSTTSSWIYGWGDQHWKRGDYSSGRPQNVNGREAKRVQYRSRRSAPPPSEASQRHPGVDAEPAAPRGNDGVDESSRQRGTIPGYPRLPIQKSILLPGRGSTNQGPGQNRKFHLVGAGDRSKDHEALIKYSPGKNLTRSKGWL